MYPPSPPLCDFQVMIGETLAHHVESELDPVENSKPPSYHHYAGANNIISKRQALLKKGGRKARSTPAALQSRHHHHPHRNQKHPSLARSNPSRFSDINNMGTGGKSATDCGSATSRVPASSTAITLHHQKQGAKKEVLKSKPVRTEKSPFSGGQPTHSLNKYEHPVQSLNTTKQKIKHITPVKVSPIKRNENSCRLSPASLDLYHREGIKIPLNPADYFKSIKVTEAELISEEDHKDGKKNYAGAKFSEPPSPSVLPKPPSHWVGDNTQEHLNPSRALMTVHLKTLLKLHALP
ncbi:proline-rich nuclear receptor coactivator 1-like [Huso huso]|uniref:Proline-rich nuclear receptor coactivator 1-like n=1 Tax=Huso huso TaxID=61971 RepID=A0ABR0ZVI3_HUSHU